jgi:hypothetical protein
MKAIEGYEHRVGVHCETGSLRNLLAFAGLDVSEAMIFGVGSGPAFYYLFFAKGPSTLPLVGIRNNPGSIWTNISKRWGVDISFRQYRDQEAALREANLLIDVGRPVSCSVDMFYMKYLPFFLQVHAPAHFIVLMGRDAAGGRYLVSDPYHAPPGVLDVDTLKAAWAPGATFSKDNLLAWVKRVPETVDWEGAALAAMKDTCRNMLLPPGVNKLFFFVGVEGMRAYARALASWGRKYRGVVLREGVLFNAVAFEDQGTGGGAFRVMYGAFLKEVAELFGSSALASLGDEMAAHGQAWRRFSRKIAVVGKKVPKEDDAYDAWYAQNAKDLHEGLRAAADDFLEKASFEARFFADLRKVVTSLERR